MRENSGRFAFNVVAVIWAVILGTPLAQPRADQQELRLSLKQDLLTRINRDRAASGLKAVKLDPQASEIADRYCLQQIRNRTTGHFTIDGLAPYMRYSFAGGNDGVSENAAAWSANYTFSDSSIPELVRKSQDAMISERPPHDGHRQTILDPHATHVGLGLAWEKGEFRLVQEFVRRYIHWSVPLPRGASVTNRLYCEGRPLPGFAIEAISVYHEPFPTAMAMVTVNKIETYGLPRSRRDFLPRSARVSQSPLARVAAEARDARAVRFVRRSDGSFSFHPIFADGPGVYTIVAWVRRQGGQESIAASNISIRVDAASSAYLSSAAAR